MSDRRTIPRWVALGVTLAVLWLFVRGVQPSLRNLGQELVIGLALGLPVAYLFRRLFAGRVAPGFAVEATPYATLYLATFLYDLLTANVDVAYRTLAPSKPIYPQVFEVPLRVEKSSAITTIANSITLTPGTLTMDHDPERNVLYVHAIDGRDRDAVVAPIRRWEDYALVIFGEEKKPGDPIPTLEPPSEDEAETGGESDGE
ncbi:Na+/H+ antiporter subunit E [Halospeciosus flavus]|uniref:Na+/H+ antiporter subunit E n=1 Tax=Halospeciosus flavus TaxID=3032283 RepID=A0ABD5Z4J2_9EURY